MDAAARDEFLGDGGTGVLSYARGADEPPYSVPVSYGYDAAEETFYFRLAASATGEKADLPGRPVSFVTHGETDRWRSVVASGRLESTTKEGIATESLAGLERVHIPLFDVFDRPPGEVPFEFYRLAPDELTARVETPTAP
jgi:nitroimidazol reductase NimA-like FMN-containing flavoprotein (pyridoxamine 5'-phosphate oxidase superfamily)